MRHYISLISTVSACFFVLLLLLALPVEAAEGQKKQTFAEALRKSGISGDDSFFTFNIENDTFGGASDRYYTSGVRLSYFDVSKEPPAIARLIDYLVPSFEVDDQTAVYYSLGQNLYTPEDIARSVPDPSDRPYAGFLYGAFGLTNVTKNHIDDVEMTLGVVGPVALGKQTQKIVHDIVGAQDPKGWEYQLKNEPAAMLSWQRRWPEAYATDFGPFYFRASPHVNATVGNVYTYGATGLTLQLMPERHKWQSQPLRVRPAIPGTGAFFIPEGELSWSVFAGVEGRAVARDIFLDGNTFENSPSVDKELFVADANVGFSLSHGRARTSYTLNWRSKTFKAQNEQAIFGAITLSYRF